MTAEYRDIDWEFDWVTFAVDLKERMNQRKETFEDVARKTGLSTSRVRNIVAGSGHHLMWTSNFLRVCNTYDLDPRAYWTLG